MIFYISIGSFILLTFLHLIISIDIPITILPDDPSNTPHLRSLLRQDIDIREMGFNIAIKDIRVGYPPQKLSLLVSMNTKSTWIIEDNLVDGFNRKRSTTIKLSQESSSISYKDEDMKGTELMDIFSIGKVQLYNYPFLATERASNSHDKLYNGALGLGYKYEDKDLHYSFIDQAKKAQIVTQSIYSFNLKYTNTGVFSFGEYPKGYNTKTFKYYRTIPLRQYIDNDNKQPNINWDTSLDSIYIEGKFELFQVRTQVIFSIGNNSILVTKPFWEYFLEKVANKYIANKDCSILNGKHFDYIICNDSFDVNHFGAVSFILGKTTLTITPDKLFKMESKRQLCLLYYYKGYDRFLLGLPLFREYLSVFDKETNQIGFLKYSHMPIDE